MNTRWRFVIGLADDMIGYMFPGTNAVGVPTLDNLDRWLNPLPNGVTP